MKRNNHTGVLPLFIIATIHFQYLTQTNRNSRSILRQVGQILNQRAD